jgi:hypothetical protein
MKSSRTLVAICGIAATLAILSMAERTHAAGAAGAAGKSSLASPVQATKSKPTPGPIILVLCRPYQTCPP